MKISWDIPEDNEAAIVAELGLSDADSAVRYKPLVVRFRHNEPLSRVMYFEPTGEVVNEPASAAPMTDGAKELAKLYDNGVFNARDVQAFMHHVGMRVRSPTEREAAVGQARRLGALFLTMIQRDPGTGITMAYRDVARLHDMPLSTVRKRIRQHCAELGGSVEEIVRRVREEASKAPAIAGTQD